MGSLKEEALNFKESDMGNISELDVVSVDIDLKTEERTNSKGETYNVEYFEKDGRNYRVPVTVKKDLKAVLEKKPELKNFAVSRTGTTKDDTRYTVIPLD